MSKAWSDDAHSITIEVMNDRIKLSLDEAEELMWDLRDAVDEALDQDVL